jgi:hypothetical protein
MRGLLEKISPCPNGCKTMRYEAIWGGPSGNSDGIPMREVLTTNNPVDLSYAEAVLTNAGVKSVVFDTHMSVLDGSMGILPRRVMVADADESRARALLKDALNP